MTTKTKTIIKEQEVTPEDSAVKIAVMNNDITHVNQTLTRIEGKFDDAIKNFVTIDKLADAQKASDDIHQEHQKSITVLQNDVRGLQKKDDTQQGSIDATRRILNTVILIITAVGTIIGGLWWITSVVHK